MVRLIVPPVELPIEFHVKLNVRFVSSITKLTGKWGAHIKVVSCAVHHQHFRVIEGLNIPKLNRRTPFISDVRYHASYKIGGWLLYEYDRRDRRNGFNSL